MEMLETIHHSSEKILTLVNELLNVSVIESGHLELKMENADLRTIFEKCIKLNKNIAEKKEMSLSLDIEGEIPAVNCDPKKIEEVLTNFVTNALKYSQPKTAVRVLLKTEEGKLFFSVTDQGQGISSEEQGKLFKTFSKTTSETTGGESSTGLGLSIVKKIIEAHGGEIGVQSEIGKGSTFYAKIPLKQEEGAE